MNKPYDEAYALIEDMVHNYYQWGSECALAEKALEKGVIYEFSAFGRMNAKVKALYQKIDNWGITCVATTIVVTLNCEICETDIHIDVACQIMVVAEPTPEMVKLYPKRESIL